MQHRLALEQQISHQEYHLDLGLEALEILLLVDLALLDPLFLAEFPLPQDLVQILSVVLLQLLACQSLELEVELERHNLEVGLEHHPQEMEVDHHNLEVDHHNLNLEVDHHNLEVDHHNLEVDHKFGLLDLKTSLQQFLQELPIVWD